MEGIPQFPRSAIFLQECCVDMSSALFALLSAQIYAGDKAPTTTGLDPLLSRGRAQVGGGITWPKAGNLIAWPFGWIGAVCWNCNNFAGFTSCHGIPESPHFPSDHTYIRTSESELSSAQKFLAITWTIKSQLNS